MRLLLAFSVTLALTGMAQARDLTFALTWDAGLPGEVVGVLRHSDGTILHSQRQFVSGDQTAITLEFTDLPRQAHSIQAALMDGTRLHAQTPVLPLEARSARMEAALSPVLALGFTATFDCADVWGAVDWVEADQTARLRSQSGTKLDLQPAENGWTGPDGAIIQRRGTQLNVTWPDQRALTCPALPVPPLLPTVAQAPFDRWTIALGPTEASISLPEGTLPIGTLVSPVDAGQLQGGVVVFRSDQFELRLSQGACGRADHLVPYPLQAELSLPDAPEGQAGCAGSPLTLLAGREWRVTSVLGQALGPEMTIAVAGADVSGRGSCNRYLARLGIEAGRLRVTELGTTRVGCPISARNQEMRFLDALEGADGFSIGANGVLVLRTGAMPVLTAERKP
jgi:heat shock protein HslJ